MNQDHSNEFQMLIAMESLKTQINMIKNLEFEHRNKINSLMMQIGKDFDKDISIIRLYVADDEKFKKFQELTINNQ